jgi:AraC family transcriptional regulator of adaptative response / DNA-3-methyladenine glycosylase II
VRSDDAQIGHRGVRIPPVTGPCTRQDGVVVEDFERCYGAVLSRDARFDGWFVTAVLTTGVYCRPSCPARTPGRARVRFYPSAAAAQQAGFRACKRCRPDASPGSPQWHTRQDVVARAMRLIADGVVDRDGVRGLARQLGYSPRQLTRVLTQEVGAGPLALARAQRAHTARTLLETAALPVSSVAFASGFTSVRQFNDTIRRVFACTPTQLRRRATAPGGARLPARAGDPLVLRLAFRRPYAAEPALSFLAHRAIAGVESAGPDGYARTLTLTHGSGVVVLSPQADHLRAQLWLDDVRDLAAAVQRCRRLFDLDADPVAVAEQLGADPVLGELVRCTPGVRVMGGVDAAEIAVRAVVGQQVSLAAARRLLARLAEEHGHPLSRPHPLSSGVLTHHVPTVERLAELDPATLPMPRARGRTLVSLAAALADGTIALDAGADADARRVTLRAVPGIGAWTADYVVMRGLGHPDILLSSDLGVRHAAARLGLVASPGGLDAAGHAWRPWRSYATVLLWGHELAALRRAS